MVHVCPSDGSVGMTGDLNGSANDVGRDAVLPERSPAVSRPVIYSSVPSDDLPVDSAAVYGKTTTATPFSSVRALDVSKTFDRIVALRRVNFQAISGTVTGIIGPNGAGKSTLFGILSTLLAPTAGKVLFDGAEVSEWHPRSALRGEIGMLGHQSFLYPDMTGQENLRFFGTLFGIHRDRLSTAVQHVLELVRMDHAKSRRVKHCSRGMTQRLAFARVLLQNPTLWLLDEPTTGLDVDTRLAMLDIIAKQKVNNRIVIVISHDPDALTIVADRVLRLDRGRIDDRGEVGS